MNRHTFRAGCGGFVRSLGLVFACALLPLGAVHAADAEGPNPDAGKRFATVWKIRGEVSAQVGGSRERPLREGDTVFVGERIRAASNAEAVLKTDDAGAVAVRPGAELVAERFSAQGDASDNVTVRLLTGSLRVISGWISRTNRAGNRIVTPSATIGIRGTDHEPYVLSAELAAATKGHKPGTYDKVNRGGTFMEVKGESLDVDAGKVGFARLVTVKQRALLTILMPVLLEKVPDFYVPGAFDAELDRFAQVADEQAAKALEAKRGAAAACVPADIAKGWLAELDGAVSRGDAAAIIAKFAPEVMVRAVVIGKDGSTSTIDLDRDEMAQSTLAAVKQLKDYQHRRISIEAWADDDARACGRLGIRSVVIEQGIQAGKRFRFESMETYTLERRGTDWLAVKAETAQR